MHYWDVWPNVKSKGGNKKFTEVEGSPSLKQTRIKNRSREVSTPWVTRLCTDCSSINLWLWTTRQPTARLFTNHRSTENSSKTTSVSQNHPSKSTRPTSPFSIYTYKGGLWLDSSPYHHRNRNFEEKSEK
jgi:hypothetical protein